MKNRALAVAALAVSATSVQAAGLDRSNQSVLPIFNDDNTFSFSLAHVNPSVTGTDAQGASYDVGESYEQTTFSYTKDLNDKFTLGFIIDQPYGADVFYNGDPTTTNLGGTGADLSSEAYTLVGKYRFNDRVSVFGGIKAQTIRAGVNLSGDSYSSAIATSAVASVAGVDATTLGAALLGDPTAVAALGGPAVVGALGLQVGGQIAQFEADGGYSFEMGGETEFGWLVGAAYEIPDIALRLAFTYHAEIEYTGSTNEVLLGNNIAGTTDFVTPEAINIDFQTGIAADTLLIASYRWTAFEDVDLVPTGLGSDLVNLDNGQRFTLGVGRRFNENFSGTVVLSYEPTGDDDLVSPLGPTDGLYGISVGGRYEKDNLTVSGGINYSWLGDARPEVGGQPVATFDGNSSVAVGLNVQWTF
ncbi:outer membrane protein transport protein [uncultured Tateyamaria sp.]|uniref:outer membrane protein transport protein n=1 Tax=Tateyamaria sp. 1078 TaxID=3417464 RepID=UPI00260211AF|nr:outer membrane protein transport protein [uncultured Tateyamaria sp.]